MKGVKINVNKKNIEISDQKRITTVFCKPARTQRTDDALSPAICLCYVETEIVNLLSAPKLPSGCRQRLAASTVANQPPPSHLDEAGSATTAEEALESLLAGLPVLLLLRDWNSIIIWEVC